MDIQRPEVRLQDTLADVTRLLRRHQVLQELALRQQGPEDRRDLVEQLQQRQNLAELDKRLRTLHPADLAYVLEVLPPEDRQLVWQHVTPEGRGAVLVEVSDALRESLVEWLDRDALVAALRTLDADDLGYLADAVPADVLVEASHALDAGERTWLHTSISYDEDSVGHLMSPEVVSIRDTHTVDMALVELRTFDELPPHTDRLYIVDARNVLRGAVPLHALLVSEARTPISSLLETDLVAFTPHDDADDAAKAFERYDLISAPVVDERGKLLGRVTVDVVMDFIRDEVEQQALGQAGLAGEEDLFAPVWDSARNRWPWLMVNIVTALTASRVIGVFEGTIEGLVALAALMPIVASIAGNTGNQTIALVIRGLALDQIQPGNRRYLFRKEVTVSLLNGVLWGGLMGLPAIAIYRSLPLGLVMMAAVALNLIIAALAGVFIPLGLRQIGRDPAQGASVLLTFLTDSLGFLLFLGMATLFLT
jgi:magnesium transporter